jgi:hypothetical protein
MKKKRKARRKHRRNPSSHPILAAIATLIVEGAFTGLLFNIVRRFTSSPALAISVADVGSTVGGYFAGAKLFPQSKMPILVGSVIHSMLTPVVIALTPGLWAPRRIANGVQVQLRANGSTGLDMAGSALGTRYTVLGYQDDATIELSETSGTGVVHWTGPASWVSWVSSGGLPALDQAAA